MSFWINVLKFLDTQMTKPTLYGWFHILSLILIVLCTVAICATHKRSKDPDKRVWLTVFITAVVVFLLEVYKQINYSFSYTDESIAFDFQWYAFPWQFCSTPMYIGLLVGIFRKGKIHDSLCAYLATFAIFAGTAVMLYPNTIYISTIGINIQTTICHGSMMVVGIYMLYSGYVKLEHKTILKALPVFAVMVGIAVILNEIAYRTGLLETDTFNMFFISPYCDPSLPVYSLVQGVVPFPLCLVLYVAGFTAAAYIILLIAMGVRKLAGICQHFHPVKV